MNAVEGRSFPISFRFRLAEGHHHPSSEGVSAVPKQVPVPAVTRSQALSEFTLWEDEGVVGTAGKLRYDVYELHVCIANRLDVDAVALVAIHEQMLVDGWCFDFHMRAVYAAQDVGDAKTVQKLRLGCLQVVITSRKVDISIPIGGDDRLAEFFNYSADTWLAQAIDVRWWTLEISFPEYTKGDACVATGTLVPLYSFNSTGFKSSHRRHSVALGNLYRFSKKSSEWWNIVSPSLSRRGTPGRFTSNKIINSAIGAFVLIALDIQILITKPMSRNWYATVL